MKRMFRVSLLGKGGFQRISPISEWTKSQKFIFGDFACFESDGNWWGEPVEIECWRVGHAARNWGHNLEETAG